MKLVEKMLLLKPQTTVAAPVTWASYIASLALPAWWRMRDTSGVTVVNSGSLGSAVNLTATAWTMGQAGQLGAGEAGLADGANTRLQCANNATLADYTTWEWAFLVNPSGAGESNIGAFMSWGSADSTDKEYFIRFGGTQNKVHVGLYNTVPTLFNTLTTSAPPIGSWSILFVAFDNAGDRKPHVRLGVSGAVNELGYSAQAAVTGTYKVPTNTLNLCNASIQTTTLAGLLDEAYCIGGRTFTPAERLQMTALAGC